MLMILELKTQTFLFNGKFTLGKSWTHDQSFTLHIQWENVLFELNSLMIKTNTYNQKKIRGI